MFSGISWQSRKQKIISKSNIEAEYITISTISSAVAEVAWITFLLRDLGIKLNKPLQIFLDNLSVLQLTINPKFHKISKHFKMNFHYIREKVARDQLTTRFRKNEDQIADLLIKPVDKTIMEKLKKENNFDVIATKEKKIP